MKINLKGNTHHAKYITAKLDCGHTSFALYIFAFLLTEFTVNVRCAGILGEGSVTVVYSVGIVCTSLGYAGFYASRRLIRGEGKHRVLIAAFTVAYLLLTLCFMFTKNAVMFAASGLLALFMFGYIGGFTHYATALFLFEKNCSGRVVGTAIALAILLQFAVQNLFATDIALLLSLFLSACGILYLVMRPAHDWMFENPLPYAEKPSVSAKSLAIPACIVALMSMCTGLGDGIITQLHAVGALNLISYSRLLYALGALLAGFIADMAGGKLLPLCTLCMLAVSSTMSLLLDGGTAATNELYVSTVYLFSGFYVMYLTITFINAAPMTDKPDLWAGMGRIVRGVFIGITAVFSNSLLESAGQQGIAMIGTGLTVLVLILFVAGGGLNVRTEKREAPRDRMPEFVELYKLTPREEDVLVRLLGDEETNVEIAEKLGISVRVLQRYVASIYEKAGVQTRVGLVKLYYSDR